MNIEIFSLCKYADDNRGALTLYSIFDVINSPQIPIVIPSCYLAFKMRLSGHDLEKHHFQIRLVDPDGKDIMPKLNADYQNNVLSAHDTTTANLPLHVQNLKIENYGKHSFILSADGHEIRTFPLYVMKVNTPAV